MKIVRGAVSATISFQPIDANGSPADPGAPVTVEVTRWDGSAVTAGAVAGTGSDVRTASIGAAELAQIDRLTAVWSIDGTPVAEHTAHVVGGRLTTPTAAKATDPSLVAQSDADLWAAINAVEDLVEGELNRRLFARLEVERTDCGPIHFTDVADVQSVRGVTDRDGDPISVSSACVDWAAISDVSFVDGGEVAYVAGMSEPPADLMRSMSLAIRMQLSLLQSGNDAKAESFRAVDGEVIGLARAGIGQSITGNDDVDRAIKAHKYDRVGIA